MDRGAWRATLEDNLYSMRLQRTDTTWGCEESDTTMCLTLSATYLLCDDGQII